MYILWLIDVRKQQKPTQCCKVVFLQLKINFFKSEKEKAIAFFLLFLRKIFFFLQEDRQLNNQKKPALKKLTLLPTVVMHLKK